MAANQAVVGILKTMLTMDTASFEAGAKKSDTTLKLVEKNVKAVGNEVAKLTPQAERMVKAFSGDKLLYSANNLVTAITKIGGATKLTEAEQAKANRTLTAAIEKYAALGQKAPPAMVALQKATAGATTETQRFGMSMTQVNSVLGAFGISLGLHSLVGFGRQLLETADQLVKVADRTGLTTTEVQKLQFIAGQSGNSLDELTGAISRLQNNLVTGDKGAVAAVKALGINLEQLRQATPFDQMEQIATAIQKIPDPATRAAIAIDLFGRTGAAILPTLISDFKKLGDETPLIADKSVRALEQIGDAINKLKGQLAVGVVEFTTGLGRLGEALAGAMFDILARVSGALTGFVRGMALIPGMGKLLEGTIKSLTQQTQWFKDAADATTASMKRSDVEVRKNTGAFTDYEGAVTKSTKAVSEAETAAKKAADAQSAWLASIGNLGPVFSRWIQAGNDANATVKDSLDLFRAMPPAIQSAAASIEGRWLPAMHGVAALFESTARAKAGMEELTEGGFLSAPPPVVRGEASADAAETTRRETQERLEQQRDQIVAFWKNQAGALESATLGRLGTLFFGQLGHDVEGTLKAAADEAHQDFLKIQRDGKATAEELTLAFTRWREAEERATFTFGERFSQWMGGLKQTFVSILDDMLQYFVKTFLGGLLKGLSSAKLAQGLGNALAGGGTGALLGGGASAVSGAGGAAGGGGGLLALATNPWTIGAAGAVGLGLLIAKKGLFRGGEEAININPRRDQFFGQLQAMFGGTQFQAAVMASQKAKIPGGTAERMIGAVYSADSKNEYESAQFAFLNALQAGGLKNVRGFAMGGFVPPGVVQPAILHGGRFGEDIVPRTGAGGGAKIELHQHYNTTFHSNALNAEGFDRVFKNEFLPRLQWEYRLNQQGTVTELQKALR